MRTVGIDEVGRGCWAGPLVAGAVLLVTPIEGLKDSKLLSARRREALAPLIEQRALAVGLGSVVGACLANADGWLEPKGGWLTGTKLDSFFEKPSDPFAWKKP